MLQFYLSRRQHQAWLNTQSSCSLPFSFCTSLGLTSCSSPTKSVLLRNSPCCYWPLHEFPQSLWRVKPIAWETSASGALLQLQWAQRRPDRGFFFSAEHRGKGYLFLCNSTCWDDCGKARSTKSWVSRSSMKLSSSAHLPPWLCGNHNSLVLCRLVPMEYQLLSAKGGM